MIAALLLLITGIVTLDYQTNFLHVNKQMKAYADRFVEDVGLPPFGYISRITYRKDVTNPCGRNFYYKFELSPVTCKKLKEKSIVGFCLQWDQFGDKMIEVSTRHGTGTTFRQILIHELAHCLYGVSHTEEGGPNNRLMAAALDINLTKKQVDRLERKLIVWIRNNYYSLKNGEIK